MAESLVKKDLQQAFIQLMRIMYPNGMRSREQHRDLLRCFASGWCANYKAAKNEFMCKQWLIEMGFIRSQDWWPDESWTWWTNGVIPAAHTTDNIRAYGQ